MTLLLFWNTKSVTSPQEQLITPQVAARPSLSEAEQAMADPKYRIGRGAFREVFRLPESFWVYKRDYSCDDAIINKQEYSNYLKLRDKLPEHVGLPEMVMLSDEILAAEYIEGVKPRGCYRNCTCTGILPKCWITLTAPVSNQLQDLHSGNVIISTSRKKVMVIDLGEYLPRGIKRKRLAPSNTRGICRCSLCV